MFCFFITEKIHAGPNIATCRGCCFVFILTGLQFIFERMCSPHQRPGFAFGPPVSFVLPLQPLRLLVNPPANTATPSLSNLSSSPVALCMEITVSQPRGAKASSCVHGREASWT